MVPLPLSDQMILAARGAKRLVDPLRPYEFLVEKECTADGRVEDVATLFLTNRECPFRCLMCDLWQSTTDVTVPVGAIPHQIDVALQQLPPARHIKLYNSGNFFDRQAIPIEDHPEIAARLEFFQTTIVESHPKLIGPDCLQFHRRLRGELEVAMGLETVHPQVLPALNKRMTLDDFSRAAEFLREHAIHIRAFVLLRPPWLSESEGLEWAVRSLEFAFSLGVRCCSVIPTRAGNGIMEQLAARGEFSPPALRSLEEVQEAGLRLGRGRVFVDLWDAERFAPCPDCARPRIERMNRINLSQRIEPRVDCASGCSSSGEIG